MLTYPLASMKKATAGKQLPRKAAWLIGGVSSETHVSQYDGRPSRAYRLGLSGILVTHRGKGSVMRLFGLMIAAAYLFLVTSAHAETRVALVIGNSAYKHAPALANPRNDAEGMAAALRRLKFDVLAGTDLDKPAMEKLLRAFAQKLATADVALVFYAGHGLQVHERNYLVPVDGKLEQETDLAFEAVPLDLVQGLMEQGQRTNIMILDACRDNPLARNLARTMGTRSTGIGRGLRETKAGIGTLIVYATQPGNVALDGEGKNSPFTLSLLKHIEAPGLEIRQVLTRVRNEVITATRDKQVPWDSSSLRGDFFFVAGPAPPSVTPAPAPPVDNEAVFWQSIRGGRNIADFKEYLRRWPQGVFADLARRRIAEIETAASPEPEKPAPRPAAPRPPAPGTAFKDCDACPEMVVIPAGTFMMGSPADEKDRRDSEGPRRRVAISKPFALGKYEVTLGEYEVFERETGHRSAHFCWIWSDSRKDLVRGRDADDFRSVGFAQTRRHPVVCVDRDDAKAFATWVSMKTGRAYRLPSEAEWEYAARAGTTTRFYWGDDAAHVAACRYANFSDRSLRRVRPATGPAPCSDGQVYTAPVGSFDPNGFGLYDMSGNVGEWTADCYQDDYIGAPEDGKPRPADRCQPGITFGVFRGGSWLGGWAVLRSASRGAAVRMLGGRLANLGFRLARDL